MSEYIEIKRGNDAEYNEFMKLINDTFGFHFKSNQFLGLLPKLYKKEYKPVSNNVVLKVNNEMRAAIGLFYDTVIVGDENITIGGIGNVAVLQKYRGMGYMKFAMAYCLDEMKQRMCDISVLGGRRQRYEYFSYEPGGLKYTFTFNSNNVSYNFGKDYKSSFTVRKLKNVNDTALYDIRKLYERNISRYIRNRMNYYDILSSWHNTPYVVYKDGEFKGYYVFNEDKTFVTEFGCKDRNDINEFVTTIVEHSKDGRFNISFPQYDTENCTYFEKYGEEVNINHAEMFSVFNYEHVIKAYLKLKSKYSKLADGEIVFSINGAKLPERIKITVKDNQVTVTETNDKEDVYLEHLEAMKFFFSIYSSERLNAPGVCQSWFPLPLYLNTQDAV